MFGEQTILKSKPWIASINEKRFDAVWRQHRPRIWRLVARLAGSTDLADDLTQEVALRACQAFGGFLGQSNVYSWLYRIAVNVVVRSRERHVHAVESLDSPQATSAKCSLSEPAVLAIQSDIRSRIWQAMDLLPDEQRTVLILQVYEELKYREIAVVLEIPIGTVKSRLNAAVTRLRKELNSDDL